VRIKIIKRDQLNEEQKCCLRSRISADEHRNDPGPCRNWELDSLTSFIFVVLSKETNRPIGILYRDGPRNATSVSWWLDQRFRGRGLGYDMVEIFANFLRGEGVTGIAPLPIEPHRGQQNIASEKLAVRLRVCFDFFGNEKPSDRMPISIK